MPARTPILALKSKTVVLAHNDVDTDQILPARYLTTTSREGLGQHAFADWRYDKIGHPNPDFELNRCDLNEHRILVTGRNFGCGSSREHAAWALLDLGIRAVVSIEVADIFRVNALKNGLIPIVVDEATHAWLIANPGVELTVDLESLSVVLPDGRKIPFSMDAFSRYCLINGTDELGYLLDHESAIRRFELEAGK